MKFILTFEPASFFAALLWKMTFPLSTATTVVLGGNFLAQRLAKDTELLMDKTVMSDQKELPWKSCMLTRNVHSITYPRAATFFPMPRTTDEAE